MDLEAAAPPRPRGGSPATTPPPPADRETNVGNVRKNIFLAYKTLGVVFGGLVTSPLYVYPSMNLSSPTEADYLGMYSIMFWTLTLIGVVKYVGIALNADDHGEGGTFAMYSLLCRHADIGILPSKRGYSEEEPLLHEQSTTAIRPSKLGKFFERSITARRVLLFMAILGMCMLIGDGILTPAISVLSAIDGLRGPFPSVSKRGFHLMSCLKDVPTLRGDNYTEWRKKVDLTFVCAKLDWVVDEPQPVRPTEPVREATGDDAAWDKKRRDHAPLEMSYSLNNQKWINANKKCMAFIKNTIENAIVGSIAECTSVGKLLTKIKNQFSGSSKTYATQLIKQLVTENYTGVGHGIRKHILRMSIWQQSSSLWMRIWTSDQRSWSTWSWLHCQRSLKPLL